MNYFVLPLIINDRREVTFTLSETPAKTTTHYLIEAAEHTPCNLFGLLPHIRIKSMTPGLKDLDLKDLTTWYRLSNGHLIMTIEEKKHEVKPEVVPPPKLEKPQPLTYDDLDSYVPPKPDPIIDPIPKINSDIIQIGCFQDLLEISAHTFSNSSLYLTGNLTGDFEKFKDENFPGLTVSIELKIGEKLFSGSFLLSFVHPEQFLGITLDFGSESSQLAVQRYQRNVTEFQQGRPIHENLYKDICAFYKSQGWIPQDDHSHYYQEEPNTNFYKSIFFLRETLSGAYEDIDRDLYIQSLNDNLKMLVNSSSKDEGYVNLTRQRFHQLPNLKITHKYTELIKGIDFTINKDGYDLPISLADIKNKVYNSILKVMVESFLKKEFIRYNGAKRKIRFILLVPNIYDYMDIRNTQNLLHLIFKEFSENNYKGMILDWEILTVSESDAAFLGYISKNDVPLAKDRDYIIIDAGKGTTDFSIIHTGKENFFNIQPTYRNGFAGGGNLITFAIFETVLHFIRANSANQNDAYRFIREEILANLTNNNLEAKNLFYNELERLKFNYNDQTGYVRTQWDQAKTGDFTFRNLTEANNTADIQTLIKLLHQIENISDFFGYISEACKLIAEGAVKDLKLIRRNSDSFNCAGIILTGRSFLFKPLEVELKKVLEKGLEIASEKIHTLGQFELKDVSLKGVFNKMTRLNSEKIGYPIQVIPVAKIKEPPAGPQVPPAPTPPKKGLGERLINIFFNELHEIENAKIIIAPENNLSYQDLSIGQILIGPKKYHIGSSSLFDHVGPGVKADIIFTSQGYFVRKMENSVVKAILPLVESFEENRAEMVLVIPSLFPNHLIEQYIFSLKRSDIKRAPIMPPPPTSGSTNGPKFF